MANTEMFTVFVCSTSENSEPQRTMLSFRLNSSKLESLVNWISRHVDGQSGESISFGSARVDPRWITGDREQTAELVGRYFGLQSAGNMMPKVERGEEGTGVLNALRALIDAEMKAIEAKLPPEIIDARGQS
jgi:hypothetical protein